MNNCFPEFMISKVQLKIPQNDREMAGFLTTKAGLFIANRRLINYL
jgi:hypothetical protein